MSVAKIGFTRKKVQSLTLGEKLQKLREERRMTIGEAAKQTKIQVKYLTYLEEGAYEKLPADVYVRGFLSAYAHCLDIAQEPLIKMYERERGIHETIARDDVPDQEAKSFLQPKRLIITPKIIAAAVGSIGLVVVALFLYGELDRFVSSPWLVLDAPIDGTRIESTAVTIQGTTDPQASVFINDEAVLVGADGIFVEEIDIAGGANTITVRSVNAFQKESAQTRTVYGPEQEDERVEEQSEEAQFDGVRVALRTTEAEVWLAVAVDGEEVYAQTTGPEATKVFEGRENIVITAGIGSQVFVSVNGGEETVLSKEIGLVNRTFTKEENTSQASDILEELIEEVPEEIEQVEQSAEAVVEG